MLTEAPSSSIFYLSDLTQLDLAGAFHNQGMGSFGWLLNVEQLVSLTLHNVQGKSQVLAQILTLLYLSLSIPTTTKTTPLILNGGKTKMILHFFFGRCNLLVCIHCLILIVI